MSSGGGQEIVQTGPSLMSADLARSAQISAAQSAAQATTQNTASAIQALMGQYQTSLQLAAPSMNTGNQALAQLNYTLGLPAVNPGSAPVAPTTPTLQTFENTLTPTDLRNYVIENSSPVSNLGGGYFGNDVYQGAGSDTSAAGNAVPNNIGSNSGWMGIRSGDVEMHGSPAGILSNPALKQDIQTELATEAMNNPNSPQNVQYQTQLQNYNIQNQQYQNALGLYNQYNAMGTIQPSQLSNIITNQPGFQFQQQQGIQQIQNAASATGQLNSGNLLQQLNSFGQGLASTYYQNYVNNLANLANQGQGVTQQAISGSQNLGSNLATSYTNQGQNIANAYLAAGGAEASSYLTPLANQDIRTTEVGGSSNSGMFGALGSILGSATGSGGLLTKLL